MLFGYTADILYRSIPGCDAVGEPSCASIAFEMQRSSFFITFLWICLLITTIVGNILMHFGIRKASERLIKRVRDALFRSLLRQEVAFFDEHSISSIASQLQDDVAALHAFCDEPLQIIISAVSSLLIGIFISLYYMWPVGLMAFPWLVLLVCTQKLVAKDAATESNNLVGSSDAIAIEALLNMRTVAS